MGKPKPTYRKLEHFRPYLNRLVKDKASFTISETTFTKKIDVEGYEMIFNEDGYQNGILLQLINRVRNDAKSYSAKIPVNPKPINWFDLSEAPPSNLIAKVDVKSAYWETAIKMGVISEQTNAYLYANFPDITELKKARLKALGSLASKKQFNTYSHGVLISTTSHTQETKGLYMHICETLDELMQSAILDIRGAFYYYWDCVFCMKTTHKDVINFVAQHHYGTKAEFTEIDVITCGEKDYLFTHADNKMYLIPQEKQFIINLEGNVSDSTGLNAGELIEFSSPTQLYLPQ